MGLERRQQQLAEVWKHGGRKGVQGAGGKGEQRAEAQR